MSLENQGVRVWFYMGSVSGGYDVCNTIPYRRFECHGLNVMALLRYGQSNTLCLTIGQIHCGAFNQIICFNIHNRLP